MRERMVVALLGVCIVGAAACAILAYDTGRIKQETARLLKEIAELDERKVIAGREALNAVEIANDTSAGPSSAERLRKYEQEDEALLSKTQTNWTKKQSPRDRWEDLEELKKEREFGGYPKQTPFLVTDKAKAQATQLQEELAKPFAAGRAKAEAILERIAKTYGITKKPVADRFFEASKLPALEALETSLKGKEPKEAAGILREVAKKGPFTNDYVMWFLVDGATEILQPILKAEFEAERARRIKEVEARQPDVVLNHGGGTIRHLAFSPDGKTIAVMNSGGLVIYNVSIGKPVLTLDPEGSLDGALAWSPDGKHLAVGGWAGSIRVFEVETGKKIHERKLVEILPVTSLLWKGSHIAGGEMKNVVGVYAFPEMKQIFKEEVVESFGSRVLDLEVKDEKVTDLLVQGWEIVRLKDGKREVETEKEGVGEKGNLVAYHAPTRREVRSNGDVLTVHEGKKALSSFPRLPAWNGRAEFGKAAFSSDGQHVVYAGDSGTIKVYEVTTGKEIFHARYCIGWMQDEFQHRSGGGIESVDVYATDRQITIAVGGNLVGSPGLYVVKK